jgi:hypothetical protein
LLAACIIGFYASASTGAWQCVPCPTNTTNAAAGSKNITGKTAALARRQLEDRNGIALPGIEALLVEMKAV